MRPDGGWRANRRDHPGRLEVRRGPPDGGADRRRVSQRAAGCARDTVGVTARSEAATASERRMSGGHDGVMMGSRWERRARERIRIGRIGRTRRHAASRGLGESRDEASAAPGSPRRPKGSLCREVGRSGADRRRDIQQTSRLMLPIVSATACGFMRRPPGCSAAC